MEDTNDKDPDFIPTNDVCEDDDVCIDDVDIASTFTESSTGSARRRAFSDNDLKIIREECCQIIQSTAPINSAEIRGLFKSNEHLIPLYDRFGFNSLKIKMRTERNKVLNK